MADKERPRDFIFDYVLDRLTILNDFARRHCQEPTCGARDEDGIIISCETSKACGERRMDEHLQRELKFMVYVRALVEALERNEMEKIAAADAARKGKRA